MNAQKNFRPLRCAPRPCFYSIVARQEINAGCAKDLWRRERNMTAIKSELPSKGIDDDSPSLSFQREKRTVKQEHIGNSTQVVWQVQDLQMVVRFPRRVAWGSLITGGGGWVHFLFSPFSFSSFQKWNKIVSSNICFYIQWGLERCALVVLRVKQGEGRSMECYDFSYNASMWKVYDVWWSKGQRISQSKCF
jgi:hypothetical protein